MNRDWLWDRRIDIKQAKKILRDPQDKNFILLASLLFSRKNQPKEIFGKLIDPILFCRCWPKIKKAMRHDKWGNQRIIFWQAIYEKLTEKYRKRGIGFRVKDEVIINDLCKEVGAQIRNIRNEQKLSQGELAKKLSVSQQLISRIEKGKENTSLITLTKIFKALNKKIEFSFSNG